MNETRELREVLDEVSYRFKMPRIEMTTDDLTVAISTLLNALDDAEGEVECVRQEFKDYEDMVNDNYRPLTPKEMGWI